MNLERQKLIEILKERGIAFFNGTKTEMLAKLVRDSEPQGTTDVDMPPSDAPKEEAETEKPPEVVPPSSGELEKVALIQFNPETQIIVDRAKFEMLFVNLVAQRTKMYTRQNAIPRLGELLGVDYAEAQAIFGEMMKKVMAG